MNSEGSSKEQSAPVRRGRGPTSYWVHDSDLVFERLGLRQGDAFLDLGFGPGDYCIRASQLVGESGRVYALDREQEAHDQLGEKIAESGLANIRGVKADLLAGLPLGDGQIDLCLMATVLYIIRLDRAGRGLFPEIHRVLKPGGRMAVIEFQKEEQNFGPPKEFRISPQELAQAVEPFGFEQISLTDLGYNYLIQFARV